MIDRNQDREQREPEPQAPADQLLLDRQQWLDGLCGEFFFCVGHDAPPSTCQRRLESAEEQPRDQQSHPDHEAEQADEIDRGELAETLLPKLAEIREHADREEGENEEDDAESVGLSG